MPETFDNRTIDITSRGKPLFENSGITKGQVIDYYAHIYPTMQPHLVGRPVSFERYPDGLSGEHFFQKNASDYFPEWIRTARLEKKNGVIEYVVLDDRPSLVFLADQAAIPIHVFLSTVRHPHSPDRFVFDLDPIEGDFARVRRAALYVREVLEAIELHPFVMTTGSTGLHVTTPIHPEMSFDSVRVVVRNLAEQLVKEYPDELTLEQRLDRREGRIYLDIIRNAYGQTTIAPYSLRARAGAPVATPLDWDELKRTDLHSDSYTLQNIFRRLGQKDDPWANVRQQATSLHQARRRW